MRRIVFVALMSGALLAVGAPSALARHHHRSHHRTRHHARIRHWGSSDVTPQSSDETAGTVDSVVGRTLTIKLNDGSTVSGMLTDATEIECQAAEQDAAMADGGNDNGDNGDNSGGDGSGDNGSGDNGDMQEQEHSCSSASLTAGTVVQEAELKISSGGAVWDKIELAGSESTGDDS